MINCTLRVQTYKLPQCEDGQLNVSSVPPYTAIRCEDLDPGHRVSWTITDTERQGNSSLIATCDKKAEGYNCTLYDEDLTVTREDGFSELVIRRSVNKKDGETLTCLRKDGAAAVNCSLRVVDHEYTLPQCQNGQLVVSSTFPWTAMRCEDLVPGHAINWTVTDRAGHTTTVAHCERKTDANCTTYDADFLATRHQGDASQLTIVHGVTQKAGSVITCMKDKGKFAASCNISVKAAEAEEVSLTSLPAVIGGTVGGAVLLVITVIVVVVLVKRRGSTKEDYESTSFAESHKENQLHSVDNPVFDSNTRRVEGDPNPEDDHTYTDIDAEEETRKREADVLNAMGDHTYFELDAEEDACKIDSVGLSDRAGRVVFLKGDLRDKPVNTGKTASTGPDGYSEIDIVSETTGDQPKSLKKVTFKDQQPQQLSLSQPAASDRKLPAAHSADNYNHIELALARKELPQEPKISVSATSDNNGYSLAKPLPSSSADEPLAGTDGHRRFAVDSITPRSLESPENANHPDPGSSTNLPMTTSPESRSEETAAEADTYNRIGNPKDREERSEDAVKQAERKAGESYDRMQMISSDMNESTEAQMLPEDETVENDTYNKLGSVIPDI